MSAQPSYTASTASDVAGAWTDARATAEFASTISVRCAEEGHSSEPCAIRTTANEIARRALYLARELAHQAVVAA